MYAQPRRVRSRTFWIIAGLTAVGLGVLAYLYDQFYDGWVPDNAFEQDGRSIEREMRIRRARQVTAALLRYRDATGQFPPPIVYGPDKQPLYSWRVVVALFLAGGNELARNFFWDQPWDSPANQFALARMPAEFTPAVVGELQYDGPRTQGEWSFFGRAVPAGSTYFEMTADTTPEASPLLRGLRGAEIVRQLQGPEPGDGRPADLLIVRELPEAVPWTKPTEAPFPADPTAPVTGGGGFAAGFADGTATFVPPNIDEKLLRDLATPHKGRPRRDDLAEAIGQSGKRLLYDERLAAYWARQLTSDDEDTFTKAREMLMKTGPADAAAVPRLTRALGHRDCFVRLAAAAAIVRIGRDTRRAVPALAAIAKSGCNTAPTSAKSHPGPGLLYHQEDTPRELILAWQELPRYVALHLLADTGPAAESAAPDLRVCLRSTDWCVADEAAEALSRIGAPAVPVLVEALRDKDVREQESKWQRDPTVLAEMGRHYRLTIPGALAYVGPAAVPAVVPLLQDPDPETRLAAVDTLGRMGLAAAPAETELVACLKDEKVARNAANALSRIGVGARAAVPVLRQNLKAKPASVIRPRPDGDPRLGKEWKDWVDESDWQTAAEAVGRFGPEATDAVPELLEVLEGNDAGLATRAADALCRIGPAAWPAVPVLRREGYIGALCWLGAFDAARELARDKEYYRKYLRTEGAKSSAIGLRPLVDALRGPDPTLRAVSVEALRQIGPGAALAVPALRELEGDPRYTEKVGEALRAIGAGR